MEDFNPLTFMALMASLTLLPVLLMVTTAFLKIAVVLLIVRNALGVQQVPPNMVLYGIAISLTLYVMAPVFHEIQLLVADLDYKNLPAGEIFSTFESVSGPIREFMLQNSAPDVKAMFNSSAKVLWPPELVRGMGDESLLVLIPAFVVSQLQAGFEIGFLVYLPFVVIDLIVSNLLLALGMQMVAPMTVSLPLKILLFVLVEGWSKLLHSLVLSYV